jgi:predicted transcriptional regulator
MLLTYLNALKDKGNFTFEGISNLSGVPEATLKNIFSGKTSDPRFETVSAIVIAMGGSLDAIYTATKTEDVEANAVITIKETFEHRLSDIKEHYEHRLREKDEHYTRLLAEAEKHIETIKLGKRWFRIGFVVSIFIFAMLCIAELLNPNLGWFRY